MKNTSTIRDETENSISISFVVTAYNVERYISDCLQSILRQLPPDGEIVVVEDCSEDSTLKKVESFHDKRIRLLRHPRNEGAGAAKDTGIRNCRGELITFLDGDDLASSGRVETTLNMFREDPSLKFVYGARREIAPDGTPLEAVVPPDFDPALLFKVNYITNSTVTIRRRLLERAGSMRRDLRYYEDWDMWLRASLHTTPKKTGEILCLYRINPAGTTARSETWKRPFHVRFCRAALSYLWSSECKLPIYRKVRLSIRYLRKLAGIGYRLGQLRKNTTQR